MSRFFRVFVLGLVLLVGTTAVVLSQDGGPAVPAGSVSQPSGAGSGDGSAAPAAAAPGAPGMTSMVFYLLLMFGLLYFLMIRPQKKKMKEHEKMLSELNHGDDVVTSGGIIGKVTGITEKVVTMEIDDNVRLRILKSQVAQIVKGQIKDLAPQ